MRNEKFAWWQTAVFYEIYPRSFFDSNGDGVGDLNGIIAKLDYFVELGIDALWITPFFPSPQVDFGYDVSDYAAVDVQFGTLADFDQLIVQAHQRNLKIVVDFVINHTSDQHEWFKESRASKTNPKRDWYIWREAKPDGSPPNNWNSAFGPCAWTFDEKTQQFYYHYFYPQQPDLNWRNPAVECAMFNAAEFWLQRGVDGFRLDAVNWLFEDPKLRDNPTTKKLRPGSTDEYEQTLQRNRDLPETHEVLKRLRQLSDKYDGRILIGEIWVNNLPLLMEYYGDADNELQLPFNFFLMLEAKTLSATAFRRTIEKSEKALQNRWTTHVLSNHDNPRAFDRYGDGANDQAIAKLLATMLLTLRGTPFIYYGEEIGMTTTDPERLEDVRDPFGKRYFPGFKGRDGERTPMQWNARKNAGFTDAEKPWLYLAPDYTIKNVELAGEKPDSIFNFYRQTIVVRRATPALLAGNYQTVGSSPHVFAYLRQTTEQTVLVALNMSNKQRELQIDRAGKSKMLLNNIFGKELKRRGDKIVLAPFEAIVLELP